MSGLQPKCYRNLQVTQNAHHYVLQRVVKSARLIAIDHLAEDDSPDAVKLARQLQLHQHAIDAIRPLGAIFDKEDRSLRADLIRRSQRRTQQRQTAAIEHTLRGSFRQRLNFFGANSR